MKVAPRVDADHQNIVAVLALLALDCPTFRDVIRSLVVDLYGVRGVAVFDAQQPAREPVPEPASGKCNL